MESITLFGRRLKLKSGIYFLIVFFLFSQFAVRQLHMPGALTYVCDLIILGLLVTALLNRRGLSCLRSYALGVTAVILLFLVQTLIGFIGNGQSVLLYIWGLRRVFAPYIYLLACIVLLDLDDTDKLLKLMETVFILNFLVCCIQFALGYEGDFLGGIYGTGKGTNGFLNLFLCQVLTVQVVRYLHHTVSLKKLACYLLMTLAVAVFAELKAVFVEIILIVALAMLLCKPSKKTWYILGAGVVGLAVAIPLLYKLYPYFANFFTWDFMSRYLSNGLGEGGYTVSGDLNRIGGMSYIYENFLTEPFTKLFGTGLGSGEYSSFSFFTSEFYKTYEHLHYSWFSHLMILLENGVLGFALYLGVFVASMVKALRMGIRSHANRDLLIITCISGVLGIFYTIYNVTLRDYNSNILFYLFMALPFVADKCSSRAAKEKEERENKVAQSQARLDATSVSVVVPVYNVEVFLSQCVESLLAQTHKNLEIILVDDGSTDSSGSICDDYAREYPQIRVVHKENGGLSSARNAGIDVAQGTYLAFVDSDDFIPEDTVRKLLEATVWGDAQVSAGGMFLTDEAGWVIGRDGQKSPKVWEAEEAMAQILSIGKLDPSFCNKLFHRDLFDGVRFPEGVLYEDMATIFRVLASARQVAHVGEPVYYYRTRGGSICNSRYSHKRVQILENMDANEAFLLKDHPRLKIPCKRYRGYTSCNILCSMLKDPAARGEYPQDYSRLLESMCKNILHVYTNPNMPLSWKGRATLVALGVYDKLYSLRRKKG